MTGLYVLENTVWFGQPLIPLSLLVLLVVGMLLVDKPRLQYILGIILLFLQVAIQMFEIILYDMTGTYFDYGMLHLRNDAFGMIESIPVDFLAFFLFSLCLIYYIIYAKRCIRISEATETIEATKSHWKQWSLLGVFLILALINGVLIWQRNTEIGIENYRDRLEGRSGSKIWQIGSCGHIINEFIRGQFFQKENVLSEQEIEDRLYEAIDERTENFGRSKGKNIVIMLAESFEWFSFLQDDFYRNQLNLSNEELRELFPNLIKFYEQSVVMKNFYSREKTDIAESLSILGSYPTGVYINYDYPENQMPYSLPNQMRYDSDGVFLANSFHNGFASFYNRDVVHKAFGFDQFMDCYALYDLAETQFENGESNEIFMKDYLKLGERNLDSEMLQTGKDIMFQVKGRFCTYITTITMHGVYYERANMKHWNDKLFAYLDMDELDDMERMVVYYMTTVMELDSAVGIMMKDLEEKGLLENTIVVVFGDHNAYYQGLSPYVKGLEGSTKREGYPRLYQVPFMLYDQNLEPQEISKFTCTADIVPTLLDLLGIDRYENLYYGKSVFSEEESLLYSRAYDVFLNDKIIFRTFDDILYQSKSLSKREREIIFDRASMLMDEVELVDSIYMLDYFKTNELRPITRSVSE